MSEMRKVEYLEIAVVSDQVSPSTYQHGRNVGGKVRTLGFSETACKYCKSKDVFGTIYLTDNKLTKVELGSEELDFGQELLNVLSYYFDSFSKWGIKKNFKN